MAANELFKMYTIDNLCDHYIFKTISPIDFKSDIKSHITSRTNAIDFVLSIKKIMAAIMILKR